MAFEAFIPTGGRYTPSVSLSRGGFGLSAGFQRKYESEIGDIMQKGAQLFYDIERKAVGFRFAPVSLESTIKLKKIENGGYYIPAKEFLIKYDIDREVLESRYLPKEELTPEGKIFVIELKSLAAVK